MDLVEVIKCLFYRTAATALHNNYKMFNQRQESALNFLFFTLLIDEVVRRRKKLNAILVAKKEVDNDNR